MFDWLDNTSFFFFGSNKEPDHLGLIIQTSLTILAAFLGAGASAYFNWRGTQKTRKKRLNSLAISVMHKISKSASRMRGIKNSFFDEIEENTPTDAYWQRVKPGIAMIETNWELTDEEFEFLLGNEGGESFAYSVVELLELTQINIRAMNEYSIQRQRLSASLDPHTESITQEDGTITTALHLEDHPEIARQMLETSELCALVFRNIGEAIRLSVTVADEANERIPSLTENPKFNKRVVVNNQN